jgi:hypothetical protein
MGAATGDPSAAMAAAFYAAHHVLAKGALFLAVGVVAASGARRLWPVLLPAAVVALGFAGLPLSGGSFAKLAVKSPLGDGTVGLLAIAAAVGSALLMTHFLHRLAASAAPDPQASTPAGLAAPWLVMAGASVVIPWALFLAFGFGTLGEALAPSELWKGLWPVLLGGVLAVGLRRWGQRLPCPPEGDIVVLGERAARAMLACGASLERADGVLRRWPVAGISLLALVVALAAIMLGSVDNAHP